MLPADIIFSSFKYPPKKAVYIYPFSSISIIGVALKKLRGFCRDFTKIVEKIFYSLDFR